MWKKIHGRKNSLEGIHVKENKSHIGKDTEGKMLDIELR